MCGLKCSDAKKNEKITGAHYSPDEIRILSSVCPFDITSVSTVVMVIERILKLRYDQLLICNGPENSVRPSQGQEKLDWPRYSGSGQNSEPMEDAGRFIVLYSIFQKYVVLLKRNCTVASGASLRQKVETAGRRICSSHC